MWILWEIEEHSSCALHGGDLGGSNHGHAMDSKKVNCACNCSRDKFEKYRLAHMHGGCTSQTPS